MVTGCAQYAPEGLPEAPVLYPNEVTTGCDVMDTNRHFATPDKAQGSSGRVVSNDVFVEVDGDITFVQPPEGQFTVGWGYGVTSKPGDDAKLIDESVTVGDVDDGVDGIGVVLADVASNDAGKVVPVTIDLVSGPDVETTLRLTPNEHGFVTAIFDKSSFDNVRIQDVTIGAGDASLTLTSGMTYEVEPKECSSDSDPAGAGSGGGPGGTGNASLFRPTDYAVA